jgi:hypothetical protein
MSELQLRCLIDRNPLRGRNVQGAEIVDTDSVPRVALKGVIAFYDFRLRFDVLLDTVMLGGDETSAYSNLKGMCLGSTEQVAFLSSALLFNPVLPTKQLLQVPVVGFSVPSERLSRQLLLSTRCPRGVFFYESHLRSIFTIMCSWPLSRYSDLETTSFGEVRQLTGR